MSANVALDLLVDFDPLSVSLHQVALSLLPPTWMVCLPSSSSTARRGWCALAAIRMASDLHSGTQLTPSLVVIAVFPQYSLSIPSLVPQYSLDIPSVFPQNPLSIPSVFSQYSLTSPSVTLSIPLIFSQYSLSIPSVFPQYSLSIPSVFPQQ